MCIDLLKILHVFTIGRDRDSSILNVLGVFIFFFLSRMRLLELLYEWSRVEGNQVLIFLFFLLESFFQGHFFINVFHFMAV